jgi:hypothetical protein
MELPATPPHRKPDDIPMPLAVGLLLIIGPAHAEMRLTETSTPGQ